MSIKEITETETVNKVEGGVQVTMEDIEAPNTEGKYYESNAGDGTTVYEQYLHGVALYSCIIFMFY